MSELVFFILGIGLGCVGYYMLSHPDKRKEFMDLFKKKDAP